MFFSDNFFKWFYFTLLIILFGSAFILIEISLKSFSPVIIAISRVTIAFIVLFIYSLYKNYNFKFVIENFFLLFILALSGTTIPFLFISWAQLTINSSETGILIGFMPIFTIIGSHYFFKYESITPRKLFGFILGFIGLLILLFNNEEAINIYDNLIAKILVIIASLFYALNALLIKKASNIDVIPLAASVMLISSIQLLTILIFTNSTSMFNSEIYTDSIIALLVMSLLSTALATVVYYKIIQNYGANFMSLVNYPIPIFAFFAGVIFLSEKFNLYSVLSLLLVIISIYISQRK